MLCGIASVLVAALVSPVAAAQLRQPQTADMAKSVQEPAIECAVTVKTILGSPIPARILLIPGGGASTVQTELPEGAGRVSAPAGTYTAAVYAYDAGVPILVEVQSLTLSAGAAAELNISVLEGSSGNRSLSAFDGDFDLALDRVELEQGTDPGNPRSVPAETPIEWPSPILDSKGGWYRGELHAYSSYGPGSEKVGQLIRRAEAADLDFLAITDPNTLAAARDPEFQSSKLVLIPAMEWQHPALGSALLYAPPAIPSAEIAQAEAQALALKLQAQGGIFAVAHPTLSGRVWQWGLNYPNAIEVWFGEWRATPPMELSGLSEIWARRDAKNQLVNSIAVAAATKLLSANGQAAVYYDRETARGVHASMIAGSGSTGKKQRLGSPMTYVWAREKSLTGILEGIRIGRTFVTAGPDAPFIEFMADIMADESTDVGSGGMVPINVESLFSVGVEGAKGGRVEILFNGYPVRSHVITHERFMYSILDTPGTVGVYRARVLTSPKEKGYGPAEVLAMSSPIYAQSFYVDPAKSASNAGWIDVESTWEDPSTVVVFDPSTLDPSQVITLDAPSTR